MPFLYTRSCCVELYLISLGILSYQSIRENYEATRPVRIPIDGPHLPSCLCEELIYLHS